MSAKKKRKMNLFILKTKDREQDARDIFRDTHIAKKSIPKERIEPTTYWLGNTKKFQAPAGFEPTTYWLRK